MKAFYRHWSNRSLLHVLVLSLLLLFLFLSCQAGEEQSDSSHFFAELRFIDGLLQAADPDTAAVSERLDRLEQQISGSDYHLSLLKRRRQLAALYPEYQESYYSSLQKLRTLFPYSEKIAVIALSGLVSAKTVLSEEDKNRVKELASLIRDERYLPLLVLANARLGTFERVKTATENTTALNLLEDACRLYALPAVSEASYTTDAALLRIVKGDRIAALSVLDRYIEKNQDTVEQVPAALFYLAALLQYDFGDLSRAALYAKKVQGIRAELLLADIQYKNASYTEARYIWQQLLQNQLLAEKYLTDVLYNLAMSSTDIEQKKQYLEMLLERIPSHVHASIAYSRILDDTEAVSYLTPLAKDGSPLLKLELIKRTAGTQGIDRTIGELWLLINQYPEFAQLYPWAAYYMNLTGRHEEAELLLQYAQRYQVDSDWSLQYKAFYAIQHDKLDEAEKVLRSAESETVSWHIAANLAVIMEARRSPASAIELYQLADSACTDSLLRSEIQLRIANNFYAMNRVDDAVRSLEYALDLDKGNMKARAALRRMQQ